MTKLTSHVKPTTHEQISIAASEPPWNGQLKNKSYCGIKPETSFTRAKPHCILVMELQST